MKSDDIRNLPEMKAIWRREKALSIICGIVLVVLVLSVGCFRWPVVILKGGSGAGDANTLPSK